MKIPKPTAADTARFRSLFEGRSGIDVKPMFGNLAAFVTDNQQMCSGLFGSDVGLRLPDAEREELLSQEGSGTFGPAERPMKQYANLPAGWREEETNTWIERAIAHTRTLPAKKKKAKR